MTIIKNSDILLSQLGNLQQLFTHMQFHANSHHLAVTTDGYIFYIDTECSCNVEDCSCLLEDIDSLYNYWLHKACADMLFWLACKHNNDDVYIETVISGHEEEHKEEILSKCDSREVTMWQDANRIYEEEFKKIIKEGRDYSLSIDIDKKLKEIWEYIKYTSPNEEDIEDAKRRKECNRTGNEREQRIWNNLLNGGLLLY